ncbi:U-box domain-containing protein 9-like [Cynara cardunculus var. scolymus]|uniref:RING-type E3 ubiquitin transferase n=1 Tax=Cynara cardunculus var. scolymus TaxID=59895 RepID=A0A118K7I0_CYNCS|nr:U-box domain-containing protein 9-like [Cynara cardunculus var. scolymus]KVI12270.1 Armadillo-like helical [Cynara cardunculus var. scolymus]
MAKNEAIEGIPNVDMATMTELKKELRRIVQLIVEDTSIEDENEFRFMEFVEKSNKILQDLKILKEGKTPNHRSCLNNNGGTTSYLASCPQQFRCPLSKELMRDPVIISSGQTYDRHMIQEWLKSGNRTCPRTQEVLSHTILTPNHLIKDLITQWCKNHHVQFPNPLRYSDEYPLVEADRNLFIDQINKLSSTLSDQKEAAKTLRSLTKRTPSFRALFGESDEYIRQLLIPLQFKSQSEIDNDLHEDLITTLLNVSIHESNKKPVAETPMVISVLMDALRSGKIETRSNAAATLFTLSAIDSNKSLIGKAGALKPLFDLLEDGQPLAMKDVASAIFSLCMVHENRSRAVKDGAVRVLLDKIVNQVHVDELLAILAMLSSNRKAMEELGDFGAVSILISLIKETNCEQNKENCIAILYDICYNDRTKWKEMREEEKRYGTLSELVQNGTSRAKRKAGGLLDRIRGSVNRTHTT